MSQFPGRLFHFSPNAGNPRRFARALTLLARQVVFFRPDEVSDSHSSTVVFGALPVCVSRFGGEPCHP
jgi:hypothetical protein